MFRTHPDQLEYPIQNSLGGIHMCLRFSAAFLLLLREGGPNEGRCFINLKQVDLGSNTFWHDDNAGSGQGGAGVEG